MTESDRVDISSLVAVLTTEFPAFDSEKLSKYLRDIVEWNDRAGLVSKRSTGAALGRLVRQSAQSLDFIIRYNAFAPQAGAPKIVDVGTGAGFPGVIWKLLTPDMAVTLVERKSKKSTFLRRIAVVLELDGLEVLEADAAEVAANEHYRLQFDVAVSFAVGSPEKVAPLISGLLKENGCYCSLRPHREKNPPVSVGSALSLVATEHLEYGIFCLYRKGGD